MTSATLLVFLSGAAVFGMVMAATFFLRFWVRTRDRLFLAFGASFALLGLVQAMLTFSDMPVEERSWLFLIRLLAFVIILASIGFKNRKSGMSD